MTNKKPYLIEFPSMGRSEIGYISIGEVEKNIPFQVKRTFWTYYTPESVIRGRHAHHLTEMILIAVSGRIVLTTETIDGQLNTFKLEKPNQGVYIPPFCWHTMHYNHTAVQLVLASTHYDPEDYIRDYEAFKALSK